MSEHTAVIQTDIVKGTINKNIYGHFAEHLGRGIYEGIWVGTESSIPHINGIRKDVLEALKQLRIPVLRWPGAALRMNIIGLMVWVTARRCSILTGAVQLNRMNSGHMNL